MYSGCITDIGGVTAGHDTDAAGRTGCTAVLLPEGSVCGVDVRGSAPGTRETDLLRPTATVQGANTLMLCGGSAFGLAAADGAVRWLEEQGAGFDTGYAKVPIVCAAVLYDLGVGSPAARPTADNGYAACKNATDEPLAQGNFGAGTGATTGKAAGMQTAGQGGFGAASIQIGDATVAACFAVNALGDVFSHTTGEKRAGMRGANTADVMMQAAAQDMSGKNTVIGIVGTDASLTKEQTCKLAQAGQDGIAMCVRPAHTMFDGDTVFSFGTGEKQADFNAVLAAGALAAARAIENAVSGDHS